MNLLIALALGISAEMSSSCDARIVESTHYVGFSGCISADSTQVLQLALERDPKRPLVVQSGGGDVKSALVLAATIARLQIPLIVRGYCLSSCANYLLPAAPVVDAEVGGVIGFHGDARTTLDRLSTLTGVSEAARRGVEALAEAERQMGGRLPKFDRLHLAQMIATAEQGLPVAVRIGGQPHRCRGMGRQVWAPSPQVLLEMGIIRQVVERSRSVAPEIETLVDGHPMAAGDDNESPFTTCTPSRQ